MSEKLLLKRAGAICGRLAQTRCTWGTHITELVPGSAPLGAGGFSEAVVLTVAVTPSGHRDLHLGTGESAQHRPEPCAARGRESGPAPLEGLSREGQVGGMLPEAPRRALAQALA